MDIYKQTYLFRFIYHATNMIVMISASRANPPAITGIMADWIFAAAVTPVVVGAAVTSLVLALFVVV